jgi:hypothetical protein
MTELRIHKERRAFIQKNINFLPKEVIIAASIVNREKSEQGDSIYLKKNN